MNIFHYKGYMGSIEPDPKNKVLFGKLLHINDLVTYEAVNMTELEDEFKKAVTDYLSTCKALKREPLRPFKGSLNIRIGSDLHKKAALEATLKGLSVNEFIKVAVQHEVENRPAQNI